MAGLDDALELCRPSLPEAQARATEKRRMHQIVPILFSYLVFEVLWSPTRTIQLAFALIAAITLIMGWKKSSPMRFGPGLLVGTSLYLASAMLYSGHGRSPPHRVHSDFSSFAKLYSRGGCSLAKSVADLARDPYSNSERYQYSETGSSCELISVGPDGMPGGPPLTMAHLLSFPNRDHFRPTLFNLLRSRIAPAAGDASLRCDHGRCEWIE